MQRANGRVLHRNRAVRSDWFPVATVGQTDHQQAATAALVRLANQPIQQIRLNL